MKYTKKLGLVQIFDLMKSGKSPAQISKEYNVSRKTLHYHVNKLKKSGHIEKQGYGVWKVLKDLEKSENRPKGGIASQTSKLQTSRKKEIRQGKNLRK